jgi:hypothetical protein
MAFRLFPILGFALSLAVCGCTSAPGSSVTERIVGPKCGRPRSNDWLVPRPSSFRGERISPDFVLVVRNDVPRAVSLLARRAALEIGEADVRSLTGSPSPPHPPALHPYLIRAVDMGASAALEVRSEKGDVSVLTFRLGCAYYLKTPIIVFLSAAPQSVFVQAEGAL